MRHFRLPALLFFLLLVTGLRAEVPPLLQEVADKLAKERQHWAFTQFVREFDGDRVVLERLERYDPARGQARRWQLLKLNGKTPTAAEVETWSKRKNRPPKRAPKPVAEYIDLEHARVHEENAETISYEVPFRRSAGGLFPGDKVDLTLTINKKSRAIERAQVSIDESFKVALGLAQVIDLDLDLEMPDGDAPAHPASEKPLGSASATVNKFGKRIEYRWTEFTRHDQAPPPTRGS
jgi:hypothetical protein